MKTILVTGGAGFIGSDFVLMQRGESLSRVVTLDKLTYSGNILNLHDVQGDRHHVFVRGDIGNTELVRALLREHQPTAVIHFAAETHVDRSITGPVAFLQSNVNGTFHLLQEVRAYWKSLPPEARGCFPVSARLD